MKMWQLNQYVEIDPEFGMYRLMNFAVLDHPDHAPSAKMEMLQRLLDTPHYRLHVHYIAVRDEHVVKNDIMYTLTPGVAAGILYRVKWR